MTWQNNGSNNQSPPELDKIIANFIGKLKRALGFKAQSNSSQPQQPTKGVFSFGAGFVVVILIILWALSGIFTVGPAQRAVILRFGQYSATLGSGPHWIPRFIESKRIVNVAGVRSFSIEADTLTKPSTVEDKPKQAVDLKEVKGVDAEALVNPTDIDKNVVYVEMSVQYRVNDARAYLFNFTKPDQTLQQAAGSVLSSVIGQMKLDDVLTTGRAYLADQVRGRLEKIMLHYHTGLSIVKVNIRKAQAPEQVADAFLEVAQAGQDQQRYIQQAQAYASKVIPLAQGAALRTLADAKAAAAQTVLKAKANVAGYQAALTIYEKAPAVTKQRLYLASVTHLLQQSHKVLVDVKGNSLMYLPLNQWLGSNKVRTLPSTVTAAGGQQ